MALTLIGTPQKRRVQNGIRVTGFATFTTTSLTGELPIDSEISRITAGPIVRMLNGPSHVMNIDLGAISATLNYNVIMPYAGVITRWTIVGNATSAGHSSNILNFHAINLGLAGAGTAVVIDRALAAGTNTTDTDIAGTDLTADIPRVLGLTATTADKTVVYGDVVRFTWTVTGGTAQTAASMQITVSADGSTGDEQVYVDERSLVAALNAQAPAILSPAWNTSLSPQKRSVTINRLSTNPKSAAIFSFEYEGF